MFECNESAIELSALIQAKKLGVAEAVNAYISNIEENDKQYNAFLSVSKERALARSKEIQSQIDKGEALSPLAGVPIAIKDNISTEGIETTCASKMLSGYTPVFNAAVVEKMEKAGMVVIGKLNMDEYAMGGSSETGAKGAVHNPWDTARVAGGSSGEVPPPCPQMKRQSLLALTREAVFASRARFAALRELSRLTVQCRVTGFSPMRHRSTKLVR